MIIKNTICIFKCFFLLSFFLVCSVPSNAMDTGYESSSGGSHSTHHDVDSKGQQCDKTPVVDIIYYNTQITYKDKFSAQGKRLLTVRDILLQNRINVHFYEKDCRIDEKDNKFFNPEARRIFKTARIVVDKKTAKAIITKYATYINVFVLPHKIIIVPGRAQTV